MARYPLFLGPTYTVRSPIAACERTINLYPELNATTGQPWLLGTPGLTAWAELGSGPIRGLFYQNRRAFVVSGRSVYELYANRTAIEIGAVAYDGNPVTIHSNGTAGFQLFIVSGGHGYIYNLSTSVYTQITDADFPSPAISGFFLDGYFGAVRANSTEFKLSNLLDGLSWDGLDIAQRSWASDNIVTAITNHRELWLLGAQTSEVWVDTGASFPFAPLGGVFIEGGSYAPFSAAQIDNTICWLDGDSRGNAVVRRANGYTPERISTQAVEYHLNLATRLQDAIGFAYTDEGHAFYVLYVPTAETTWVYDVAMNLWHERANWNSNLSNWEPWTPTTHMFAWGLHLVGDRESGVLYEMRLDAYEDTIVV